MDSVRRILAYGTAYLLWMVTIALSVLGAIVARSTYQLLLTTTAWHRYTLHALNQFLTFFLAFLLLCLIVFVESFYRTGVRRGDLLARFCLLTAIELAFFAVLHVIRVILLWVSGASVALGFAIMVGELAGAAVFSLLARRLRRPTSTAVRR